MMLSARMKCHVAERSPELYEVFAEIASSLPLEMLACALSRLDTCVIRSLAEDAESGSRFELTRRVIILKALVERSSEKEIERLYAVILHLDPGCLEARLELIRATLQKLKEGESVADVVTTLAALMRTAETFDDAASCFELISEAVEVHGCEPSFGIGLADALANRGKYQHAATVINGVAKDFLEAGRLEDSSKLYERSFCWVPSNSEAVAGMVKCAQLLKTETRTASLLFVAAMHQSGGQGLEHAAVNLLSSQLEHIVSMRGNVSAYVRNGKWVGLAPVIGATQLQASLLSSWWISRNQAPVVKAKEENLVKAPRLRPAFMKRRSSPPSFEPILEEDDGSNM